MFGYKKVKVLFGYSIWNEVKTTVQFYKKSGTTPKLVRRGSGQPLEFRLKIRKDLVDVFVYEMNQIRGFIVIID